MKITNTHYGLISLAAIILVIAGVSMAYLGKSKQENPIIEAKEYTALPLPKQDNTMLRIQVADNSACKSSGLLLSEADLLSLPQQKFTTSHQWTTKPETFQGPLLSDVVSLACNNASSIVLKALNDYSITVDLNIAKGYNPIVAYSIDNKKLEIRDKGPLWIMVDLEANNVKNKKLNSFLIWQLSDIIIL